jgi:tRNA threonylcarbamoyl adenosine modification protein YjeE
MTDAAPPARCRLSLPDPAATDALAGRLAAHLAPGDTLLMSGAIGAGKSHLARTLIQTLAPLWGGVAEEVPSPTFTLVQTYGTPQGEIWHADLYRLSGPADIDDLGLTEAFGTALCLVEWPDRLGLLAPVDALSILLEPEGEGRAATLTASDPRWLPVLTDLAAEPPA